MSLPQNYRQSTSMKTPPVSYRMSRGSSSAGLGKGEIVAVNPFKSSTQGNPIFNPQKVGGRTMNVADNRIPKPPKAPDKPLMPYMRYSRKIWDQVKATNSDLKLWEVGKIIGSKWRDLPEADKQSFFDEYELEKGDYEKAMKAYHASPGYQAYLSAKSKSTSVISTEEKDMGDRGMGGASNQNSKFDRRIDIQPAEDETDYDDSVSVKNVAHGRYTRNHRLINEIFSDTTVPDVRTVVTSQRLSVLKRQVHSLTMHQDKLENELKMIEEKFAQKKRKFVEMGKNFQVDLKKVKMTAPKLDTEVFNQMVEKQKELLRKEAMERQMKAAASQATATNPEPVGEKTDEESAEANKPCEEAPIASSNMEESPEPTQLKSEEESPAQKVSEEQDPGIDKTELPADAPMETETIPTEEASSDKAANETVDA